MKFSNFCFVQCFVYNSKTRFLCGTFSYKKKDHKIFCKFHSKTIFLNTLLRTLQLFFFISHFFSPNLWKIVNTSVWQHFLFLLSFLITCLYYNELHFFFTLLFHYKRCTDCLFFNNFYHLRACCDVVNLVMKIILIVRLVNVFPNTTFIILFLCVNNAIHNFAVDPNTVVLNCRAF